MRLITPVVLLLVSPAALAVAPSPQDSALPAVIRDAGGFEARRLAARPAIDGREWIATSVTYGRPSATVEAGDRSFTLTFGDPAPDPGDFERYFLYLRRGRGAPVRIDRNFTGWVYVTPDSRFVFSEPLHALDVREWKQYPLFDVLKIANYTAIDAISRDGRRLLVSRVDCGIDCPNQRREYFELTLPK